MKKTLLFIPLLLIVGIGLSGCWFNTELPANDSGITAPAAETQAVRESASESVVAPASPSPTLEDGDVYLEALTKKDPLLCAKIADSLLKDRCADQLKAE